MNREMKPKRKIYRWLLLPLISFFGAGALYVLSIGPVVYIWHTLDLSANTLIGASITILYGPLERLPGNSPMKKALDFYVRLWDPDKN